MNTINLFSALIGFSVLYFSWRRFSHHYLELDFKFKLYELRDRVRNMIIDNTIEKDAWIFNYFDVTLSKIANESYFISLPFVILIDSNHEDDVKEMKKISSKLDYECKKTPELAKIREELHFAVNTYIFEQHKYSFTHYLILAIDIFSSMKLGFFRKLQKKYAIEENTKNIFVYPETSAALAYC